jgi:hypothetical protein
METPKKENDAPSGARRQSNVTPNKEGVNGKPHNIFADETPVQIAARIELTIVEKTDGPCLSKRYALGLFGTPVGDSSQCSIRAGYMRRAYITDVGDLPRIIDALRTNEAIVLGKMGASLGDRAPIAKQGWIEYFAASVPGIVTRSKENLDHRDGEPGAMYFDHDRKGAAPAVIARMEELGGFDAALATLDPQLAHAGFATRESTSSGMYDAETGEEFPGSGGLHRYGLIANSADLANYLKALLQRGWLHGLTYYTVGSAGQLLERSIIDATVGSPERLVFEAPPDLKPPLKQHKREMIVRPGGMIDAKALPDLTLAEQAEIARRKQEARAALGKPLKEAREKTVKKRVEAIRSKNPKITPERAQRAAERLIGGVLEPSAILHFADLELGEVTITDVLRDPNRFVGQALADPAEGRGYGETTAMLFRKDSGELWIFSFAHGRTDYRIVADAEYIAETMATIQKERLAKWFIDVAADAELTAVEETDIIAQVDKAMGGGKKRALGADLKEERDRRKRAHAEAQHEAFAATIQRTKFALLPEDAARRAMKAQSLRRCDSCLTIGFATSLAITLRNAWRSPMRSASSNACFLGSDQCSW